MAENFIVNFFLVIACEIFLGVFTKKCFNFFSHAFNLLARFFDKILSLWTKRKIECGLLLKVMTIKKKFHNSAHLYIMGCFLFHIKIFSGSNTMDFFLIWFLNIHRKKNYFV